MGLVAPPPTHPRRLVFLGTPESAVPPLGALVDAGFEVALVVTRADKRRGRRAEPTPSPVKAAAVALGIPVTTAVDDALHAGADIGVVVAFGRLIRPHVLDELPMLNVHFSLLPRWRGAAPVERALLAGDLETGVVIMAVEEGLDSGPVYARRVVPIGSDATAASLRAQLVEVGTELLVDTLSAGLHPPIAQQGEATYAAKLERHELELDWAQPAGVLARVVRVGGAWTTFRGAVLKVHDAAVVGSAPGEPAAGGPAARGVSGSGTGPPGSLTGPVVATGAGGLRLLVVQPEGRARMDATAWLNGARLGGAELLGE